MITRLERLIAAVWFGGGLFLAAAAAPAAFSASSSAAAAGNVVGAMLGRWHYLALGAPLILLLLEWVRSHLASTLRVTLLSAALLLAAGEIGADLRIRYLRASTATPISELAPAHPLRKSFGRLHGISMGLLALQVICAGMVVATERRDATPPPQGPTAPAMS